MNIEKMIIHDRFWGEIEIDDKTALKIINTPEMQRLKGISIGGYYPAIPAVAHKVSRFEHSVGVYILLKMFNVSREEQISGLLHDVSHSAFSHTIDYVVKSDENFAANQGFQDKVHANFVKNSQIADILEDGGFDVDFILETKNFKLLDNDYPDLCADRIDNALRAIVNLDYYNEKDTKKILNGLSVINEKFVFKDIDSATIFYKLFEFENAEFWSGERSAVMFFLDKNLLRCALKKGYINFEDFYKCTDAQIIEKIEHYKTDPEIQTWLSFLHNPDYKQFLTPPAESCADNNSEELPIKFRRVDPLVALPSGLKRLSDLDKKIKYDLKHNTPPFLTRKVYCK